MTYLCVLNLNTSFTNSNDMKSDKSSAVAEMGDRLAATDMSENWGWGLCPFLGSWVPI